MATLGGFEFNRCPIASFGEREEYVGGVARTQVIKRTPPLDLLRLTSKMYQALLYCEVELKEEADEHGT